jgi:acyl-coenzyme A thioesterase PaaI-like protein
MMMNEKYNRTECARINDHEAVKGFNTSKRGSSQVLRQTLRYCASCDRGGHRDELLSCPGPGHDCGGLGCVLKRRRRWMGEKAFQDYYPDDYSHCYGCGRLNRKGLQIKSRWEGDEAVAVFQPKPYHTALPGYVYGGLLASLIDCHCTGTASAAAYRAQAREMGTEPSLRFLTASLRVDYLKPTPLVPLEIRARVKEIKGRKVVVEATLSACGEVCVRGEVIAVQVPEKLEREILEKRKE